MLSHRFTDGTLAVHGRAEVRPRTLKQLVAHRRACLRSKPSQGLPTTQPPEPIEVSTRPRPQPRLASPPEADRRPDPPRLTPAASCASHALAAATRPSCRSSCAAATLAVAPAEKAGHVATATRSAIMALQPRDLSRPQVRRLLVHCRLSAPGSCAFPSPSHGGSADRHGWRSAEPNSICATSCLFPTVHSAHGQAALCHCPHPTCTLERQRPRLGTLPAWAPMTRVPAQHGPGAQIAPSAKAQKGFAFTMLNRLHYLMLH